jgi:hypothetical protein
MSRHRGEDAQPALLIQATGSAYVAALARLAEVPDESADGAARQGHEVAARLLHAAADEILRSVPDEPLARAIESSLHRRALVGPAESDSAGTRRIVWF